MTSRKMRKATTNSAKVRVLESLASLSFNNTEMSPHSTIRLSLKSEYSRIFTRLTSSPERIWLLRLAEAATAGRQKGMPVEMGTALPKVQRGIRILLGGTCC